MTTAIDTGTIDFSPFSEACSAAKLVALLTFLRFFHYVHAYGADKVRVQIADRFLSIKLLAFHVYLRFHLPLKLL